VSTTLEQLQAEALAWPLADPAALGRGGYRLDPAVLTSTFAARAHELHNGGTAAETGRLVWGTSPGELSPWLRARAREILEEAGTGLRLLPWRLGAFGAGRAADPLGRIVAVPGMEILRWRWLSLCLPSSLMVCAATPLEQRPAEAVRLLHPHEAPPGPVAHLHLHLGAVYPFEILWTRLATAFLTPTVRQPPHTRLGPEGWRWFLRAFVARRWLAGELNLGRPLARPPSLSAGAMGDLLREALDDLRNGRLSALRATDPAERRLRSIAVTPPAGAPPRGGRPPTDVDQIWADDPVSDRLPWPEGRLVQLGLADQWVPTGAATPGERLELHREVFWQYLRLKTLLFRHLVSDPAKPGLPTFVQTYRRISPYSSDLQSSALRVASSEATLTLGSVEGRTTPPGLRSEVLDLVAPLGPPPPIPTGEVEWGWTLHFLRATGPLADGRAAWPPGRILSDRYRDCWRRAEVLRDALRRWPQLLAVIRALDIAGDEREGPLWLMIPLMRRLQAWSARVAARVPAWQLRPLQLTLHAGEDFRSLLTGLQGVDAPMRWQLLRPGDRFGHALVLGIDARAWLDAHPTIEQPPWERLQDLLWLREVLLDRPDLAAGGSLPRLESDARSLAAQIWRPSKDISIDILSRLWWALGDGGPLERLGLQRPWTARGAVQIGDAVEDLLGRLIFDRATSRRAWCDVETVELRWHTELPAIQGMIRERVARGGHAVEINPSSNLVIGALGSPVNQPAFQIRPVGQREGDVVPVTINADDPTSFATCLSDEFAYARAGLITASGVGATYAQAWLDEAGANSWRFRFTTPSSRNLEASLPVPRVRPETRRWARPR